MYLDSSKEFTLEKWFKKFIEGTISILDVVYTLKATSNRKLMYIDSFLSLTKPISNDNL